MMNNLAESFALNQRQRTYRYDLKLISCVTVLDDMFLLSSGKGLYKNKSSTAVYLNRRALACMCHRALKIN